MLKKLVKKNDTVTIKLSSGEEIIGEFIEETDTEIVINKPTVLTAAQQGVQFMPWILTAEDQRIPISKRHVAAAPMVVKDEVSKAYTQSTTNIALPS